MNFSFKYSVLSFLSFFLLSVSLFGNECATNAHLSSAPNITSELNAVECDTQIILTVCEPDIIWARNYGGSSYDELMDFDQTNDGGSIFLGITYSNDYDVTDTTSSFIYGVWVVKTDQDGNITWENKYIINNISSPVSIKQTSDGGYMFVYDASDGNDIYYQVVKLDSNGNIEWEKSYAYGDNNYIKAFKETNDGGFIFVSTFRGTYTNFEGNDIESGSNSTLIVKTDSQGIVEWDANYFYDNEAGFTTDDIYQTNNNGYLFTGYVSYFEGVSYVLVVKYDENGVFQWEQTYDGLGNQNLRASQQTNDGGVILAGFSFAYAYSTNKHWITKIDGQGNIEWENSFERSSYISTITSIQQTTDNGFVISGTGNASGNFANDFMILKLDALGNIEWKEYLGGSRSDVAIKILETDDNEYLIGGYTLSSDGDVELNYDIIDIWMVKFTPECIETSNIIGQLCDDNDDCTINDIYITDCDCQGTYKDDDDDGVCNAEDGCPNFNNDIIGLPCDDNDQCTINDVYNTDCNCRGTFVDSDGDGVCDWDDKCMGFDNALIGTPCDDGDPCTVNDAYNDNCSCAGVPLDDPDFFNTEWLHSERLINYNNHYSLIEKTDDDGFILTSTVSTGSFRILKTDSFGNKLWEKYIGINYYKTNSIKQTPDGGYVLVGEMNPYNNDDIITTNFGNNDAFIIKLDATGEVEWAKGFGGAYTDEFNSVVLATDGGYFIGGTTTSDDLGVETYDNHDAWIVKLDSEGNLEWQKLYGAVSYDYLFDLRYATDGNLVFAGTRIRPNVDKANYWLVKIDTQGNTIWNKEFGGTLNDHLVAMEATSDGGYILGGFTNSSDEDISNTIGGLDFWIVKTDAQGDLVWENSYGTVGHEKLIDIKETPDGNFIIAGVVDLRGEATPNFTQSIGYIVVKIDALGNVLFQNQYVDPDESIDELYDIQVTGENEIVLTRFFINSSDYYSYGLLSKLTLNQLDDIIGTSCDDGDPCTIEDVYVDFCECAGTWIGEDIDGDGICDGKDQCPEFDDATIGDPCDDGDPCTLNDVISDDCLCAGLYTDSDDDGLCNTEDPCPFIDQDLIGMPCVDGDPCTKNEVYTADCECVGEEIFTDSDDDGVRNCEDSCPDFDDNLIGTPCDDGFDFTCGDIYRYNCECSGYPCYPTGGPGGPGGPVGEPGGPTGPTDPDGPTGPQGASADCLGIENGPNLLDACGVCDSDPNNDNETCSDCAGVPNGPNLLDACGVCDSNPDNDNQTCSDCAGVPNGTSQIDECGNCLLPDDPDFNSCLEDCKASEVMEVAICDYANGTFSVLFTLDQTADNVSFQITNNLTNEVVAVTDENYYTTENFTNGAGYSFTIAETLNPECNITFDRSALDCTTTNIELITFDGKAQENGNKLFWTTATEKSSSYFTLERSNNGTDFTVIDKIKSLGNSNTANNYQYLDKEVLKGNYYYRLLETDIAGKTEIASDVILLKRNGQSEIVYTAPVPATEFVNVTFIMEQETLVNYEVYNVTGKLIEAKIYEAIEGVNTLNVNLQNYASGMYFIKIINQENGTLVTRFVKEN